MLCGFREINPMSGFYDGYTIKVELRPADAKKAKKEQKEQKEDEEDEEEDVDDGGLHAPPRSA